MQTGISTASLFGRYYTEDAVKKLNQLKIETTEIFLESYSEYTKKFGKKLKKMKGDINVHSIHTLTTQFEPQLYSLNDRARAESFKLLEGTVSAGKEVGAKYYTFHGVARIKRTLQVRTGGCHHEITGKAGKMVKHFPGILFPGGLTGDDHRAGVHLTLGDAGSFVLHLHPAGNPLPVHQFSRKERGKGHGTLVQEFSVPNDHFRNGKGVAPVFHQQLRNDQLGGGRSHIQTDA